MCVGRKSEGSLMLMMLMKRYNNLIEKIATKENIELADKKARKGKSNTYGVRNHDKDKDWENFVLELTLNNQSYTTSRYEVHEIFEPKRRLIFRLPYYPDRIAHHAIMNILEPIWTKIFIKNTYSCIKGRGIHKLRNDLEKDLKKYPEQTTYCLKLDIKKFYPSIDQEILKRGIIRRKIKDKKLLVILDEIIDSVHMDNVYAKNKDLLLEDRVVGGVPIGNYLSQFFANLYLAYFDHWVKEELKCKFYYRYADDIVILSNDKNYLHNILVAIKLYLKQVLNLELKPNYQIFNVEIRGIDFVGFVFRHQYILLRKALKLRIKKLINKYINYKISKNQFKMRFVSYLGWLKYSNSKNLAQLIQQKTDFPIYLWKGDPIAKQRFPLYVINYYYDKRYIIHGIYRHKNYVVKCKTFPKNYIKCKELQAMKNLW